MTAAETRKQIEERRRQKIECMIAALKHKLLDMELRPYAIEGMRRFRLKSKIQRLEKQLLQPAFEFTSTAAQEPSKS